MRPPLWLRLGLLLTLGVGGMACDASLTSTPDDTSDASILPGTDGGEDVDADVDEDIDGPPRSDTLRTSGRQLLDRCGTPLVVRGVEQVLGEQLPPGNDWAGILDQIARTDSNAVRILPVVTRLTVDDIEGVIARAESHRMIVFLSPGDRSWFGRDDVRAMLERHRGSLILDAFQEPDYDDRDRWVRDASAAVTQVRGYGYTMPITVIANLYGRDLPSLLTRGGEVVAADPSNNVILGWQAYWGSSNYYQSRYGMTLAEAVSAIAEVDFPIQIGLDDVTDNRTPPERMDYGSVMTASQERGVGWLWWDWFNPYGAENNLSADGSYANLLERGQDVVNRHPASISTTSVRPCGD